MAGMRLFFFNLPGYVVLAADAVFEALVTAPACLFAFKWMFLSLELLFRLSCPKGKELAYNPIHKQGNRYVLWELMESSFESFYFYLLVLGSLAAAKLEFGRLALYLVFPTAYALWLYNFAFFAATTVRPRLVSLVDCAGEELHRAVLLPKPLLPGAPEAGGRALGREVHDLRDGKLQLALRVWTLHYLLQLLESAGEQRF